MVQLIKKGGLRERANRSRSYQGSENTEISLRPNRYQTAVKTQENLVSSSLISTESTLDDHPVNSSK